MDSLGDSSPRQLARIAGALYLINILGGAFAITIAPAMLVVEMTIESSLVLPMIACAGMRFPFAGLRRSSSTPTTPSATC
jgi:formate/nitrite transporter FocA (FNT family)